MREGRGTEMYLQDILDAMDDIESYVMGMTFEEFETDKKTFDAVVRNLGVMGEAVKNLPGGAKEGPPRRSLARRCRDARQGHPRILRR